MAYSLVPLGSLYPLLSVSYTSKTFPDSLPTHLQRHMRRLKQLHSWYRPIRSFSLDLTSSMVYSLTPLDSSYPLSKLLKIYQESSQWVQRHPRGVKQLHYYHRLIRSSLLDSTSSIYSSSALLGSITES